MNHKINELLDNDLRRGIKTVEVMGRIIKNRAGSLEKAKIEEIFESAINVHLRVLSFFFSLINETESQHIIIDFISNGVRKVIKKRVDDRIESGKFVRNMSDDDILKLSKNIFWHLNFKMTLSLITKIIHSTGSDKLIDIVYSVCDKIDTPSSQLIKHGILMWYKKNLQIEELNRLSSRPDFSKTTKEILKHMVIDHCSMHVINYKDKQRLEQKLGVSKKKMLVAQARTKS